MAAEPEAYSPDDVMPFLQSVLGACSITKTVLGAYDLIPPDPDDRDKDYRGNVEQMRALCDSLDVAPEGLADLERLLDILDRFVTQGRRVTSAQASEAVPLNRRYVAWVTATFLGPPDEDGE